MNRLERLLNEREKSRENSALSSRSQVTNNEPNRLGKLLAERNHNQFSDAYNSGYEALQGAYGKWNSADAMNAYKNTLDEANKAMSDYINTYGADDNIRGAYDNFSKAYANFDKAADLYSIYQNEDAFNKAKKNTEFSKKYKGSNYEAIQKALSKTKDEDEIEFLKGYTDYSSEDDFNRAIAKSEYENPNKRENVTLKELNRKKVEFQKENAFDKYKSIMAYPDFEKVASENMDNLKYHEIGDASDPARAITRGNIWFSDALNDEQRKVASYLLAKDEKAYLKYMEEMSYVAYKNSLEQDEKEFAQMAEEHPVLTSVGNMVAQSVYGYGGGLAEIAALIRGQNTAPTIASTYLNEISQANAQVSQKIRETAGWLPQYAYDVFSTAVPNRIGQAMFGELYTTAMGLTSFSNTYAEKIKEGATAGEAVRDGLVAGAIEFVTEQVGMEWAFDKSGKSKRAIEKVLKMMLSEGSEEVVGSIADTVYQYAVKGAESDFNQNVQKYIQMGYDKNKAYKSAVVDYAKEVAYQFAVAAGSVAPTGGVSAIAQSAYGRTIDADALNKAMEGFADTKVYDDYLNMKGKNDKLSNWQKAEVFNRALDSASEDYAQAMNELDKAEEGKEGEAIERGANALTRYNSIATTKMSEEAYKASKSIKTGEKNTVKGKEADILSMKENKDGTFTVKTSEGEVNSKDVTVTPEKATALAYSANIENEEFKEAYVHYYQGEDISDYDTYARYLYEAGRQGVDFSDQTQILDALGVAKARAIYNVGAKQALEEEIKDNNIIEEVGNEYAETNRPGTFKSGTYVDGKFTEDEDFFRKLNRTQKKLYRIVEAFTKLSGVNANVYLDRAAAADNGEFVSGSDGGTIYINLAARPFGDSAYGMNQYVISTLSHELTHWLKFNNMEAYNILEDAIVKELKKKGTFEDRLSTEKNILEKKGYKGENIDEVALEEVVARGCEDMLNNSDTMQEILSNVDQDGLSKLQAAIKKWFDHIKEFFNDLMGGFRSPNEVANDLQDAYAHIRELWTNGMKEAIAKSQKATAVKESTDVESKNSIKMTTDNKAVVVISDNILENVSKNKWVSVVKKALYTREISVPNDVIKVNADTRSEYSNSEYTKYLRGKEKSIYYDKLRAASHIDEMVNASYGYINEKPIHNNFDSFARGKVFLDIGGNQYSADVVIGITKTKQMVFYDIVNINKTSLEYKKPTTTDESTRDISETGYRSSKESISQENKQSNNPKSVKLDSTGRELTPGQQTYFANSEVRDDQGRLKVMYHGTTRAGFTVFSVADDNISYFFTDKLDVAKSYSGVPYVENPDTPMSYRELAEVFAFNTDGRLTDNGDGTFSYNDADKNEIETFDSLNKAQAYLVDEVLSYAAAQNLGSPSNYAVYINAEKPYVIDAKGALWHSIEPKDFDARYDGVEIYRVAKNEFYADYMSDNEPNAPRIFSKEALDAKFGEGTSEMVMSQHKKDLHFYEPVIFVKDGKRVESNTRSIAKYAHNNGYDSVIINNVEDIGGYGAEETLSQVVIVFNSDQVKSIYNENPTHDEDIRKSTKLDSEGNELSKGQQKFFEESKARDAEGRLLKLYHGTTSAGFTAFDLTRATNGKVIWMTTSLADAQSYGGAEGLDMWKPGEKPINKTVTATDKYMVGPFRFESAKDRDDFLKKHPNAENFRDYWHRSEDTEEEEARAEEERKIENDYLKYEKTVSEYRTIRYMLDHEDQYSADDFVRAVYAISDENDVLSGKADTESEEEFKQMLIDSIRYNLEEYPEDAQIEALVRIPVGQTGTVLNTNYVYNRVYPLYANIKNPLVIEGYGRFISELNVYEKARNLENDSEHDGIIVRNCKVGRYHKEGDIVLAKNSNQVKWTENKNPTNDVDIRKSVRLDSVERIGAADVDAKTGTAVYSVRYTLAERYKELGYNSYAEAVGKTAEQIAKQMGVSKLKAEDWIKAEESLSSIILQDAENQKYLDYAADDRYSAIKTDTDYPQGTIDLSNLCRKREIFTKMFDNLQKENPDVLFTAEDIAKIRQILTEANYEVACALCYVEDRRQHIGEIAKSFTESYKKALKSKDKVIYRTNTSGDVKPLIVTEDQASKYGLKKGEPFKATDTYVPNQYDLTTYQGYKDLVENHPTIAVAFENFNNSRGQSAARLIEGHAEYKREILKWTKSQVAKANNLGGLRVFSFSDFEAIHLIDIVQVVMDCSSKGVMIQAYTKVPSFANLVKNTGIKLNRSLIPANKGSKNAYAYIDGKAVKINKFADDGIGLVDGKEVLAFDTVEGIDITDENFLDMSDNRNVGNILVGINEKQIRLAMESDFVDYIIPFHSNQAKDILEAKGIHKWDNYKLSQLDKKINGKAKGHGINIYSDVIGKYNIKNKKDFVRAFLNECKNQGYKPRFAEFLNTNSKGEYIYTEGYHKFLVDYKLFDKNGNILKQEAVKPDFDVELMNKILLADKERSKNMKFSKEIMDKVKNELSIDKRKSTKLDISDEQYKEMKEHFGTTTNYNFGGYMLKDGTMLDFSGKHWGNPDPTTREVDHRDISEVVEDENNGFDSMVSMIGAGNIRLMPEVGGICLAVKPTDEQMKVLEKYINYHLTHGDKEVNIDFDEPYEDTVKSEHFEGIGEYDNVIKAIDNYFKGVEQSDVAKFHNMFSTKLDSNGKELTKGQQEYFKNSKVRDDQGRLVAMYHGTFGDFTVFDIERANEDSYRGSGFYFTSSEAEARRTYASLEGGDSQNKLDIRASQILEEWGYGWEGDIEYPTQYTTDKLYGPDSWKKVSASEGKRLYEKAIARAKKEFKSGKVMSVYLNVENPYIIPYDNTKNVYAISEEVYKGGYDGIIDYSVAREFNLSKDIFHVTVFNPNQIKLVTNENPTENEDIRLSTKLPEEAQKLVDKLVLENKRLTEENTALKMEKGLEQVKAEKNAIIGKITENAKTLSRWLLTNDKNNPVPQAIKEPLGKLLTSISFTKDDYEWRKSHGLMTKSEETLGERMAKIGQLLREIEQDKVVDADAYDLSQLDWIPEFTNEFETIKDTIASVEARQGETFKLAKMTTEELQSLSKMITALKSAITNMNKCLSAHNKMSVSGVGQEIIEWLDEVGTKDKDNRVLQFLELDNTVPFYFFKRLGEGGEKTFKLLMDGMNKYAFEARQIEEYAKETFSGKEVLSWRDEVKTFDVDQVEYGGENIVSAYKKTIQMTVPQIMSLYCLSKRDQAVRHLKTGGMKIGDFTVDKVETRQIGNTTLTDKDLAKIINSLTAEQREVADKIQEFFNDTCQKWGNEITMKRFGFKGMTEKNYFPISVDRNQLSSEARQKGTSLYQLLNMGFTKQINPKAKNPIEIYDIFEVFAIHSTEMAQYNSLALPVLDVIRIWNYKDLEMLDENESKAVWHSVKASIENALGKKGNQYIGLLLADLNGDVSGGRADDFAGKLMKNYKTAAVAANLQVAMLQPLSYVRAGYMIDSKYLTKGMAMKSTDDALKWCGIAVWKDMGFYNTAIHRGLEHKIMQDDSKKDRLIEKGLWLAGKADEWTWSKLWNACLLETKEKHPDLEGDDLYKKTAERLTEVIYGTQVVDSVLTRSQIMRDKTFYSKMITAFQSEPTLALNVLMDAGEQFSMEKRAHGAQAALQKHGATVRRAATVYLVSAALESALRAVMGKVRKYDGDDDDEEFLADFFTRFIEELNPLRKIPLVKDIVNILVDSVKVIFHKQPQLYTDTRMDEDIFEMIGKAAIRIGKILEGGNVTYKTVYEIAKGFDASGLPVSSFIRELKVIWNNTIGRIYTSLAFK